MELYFPWLRPDAGFYIEYEAMPKPGEKLTAPYLTESPTSTCYQTYYPLEEAPGLFLEFAKLDYQNNEEILAFANKYGSLDAEKTIITTPNYSWSKGDIEPPRRISSSGCAELEIGRMYGFLSCESLDFWKHQIDYMKNAVLIWELLQEGDTETLSNLIKWQHPNSYIEFLENSINSCYIPIPPSANINLLQGDIISLSNCYIHYLLNLQLARYPVKYRVMFDQDNYHHLKQGQVPENLLAAMWYQFLQTITGEKKFKRCAVCNNWEDVTYKKATWKQHPECGNRKRVNRYRKTN